MSGVMGGEGLLGAGVEACWLGREISSTSIKPQWGHVKFFFDSWFSFLLTLKKLNFILMIEVKSV